MDIYEAIKSDHDEIRQKISAIRGHDAGSGAQIGAVGDLTGFLLRHHEAEERTFFAELVQHDGAQHEGFHMIKEHGEHEKLLEQMQALEPGSDRWESRLDELLHDIEHHIDEEEEDIFPVARKVIDSAAADDLGTRIGQVKGGLASG